MKKILASAALAGALLAGVSTPAQAATGDPGQVRNNSSSQGYVYIYKASGPGQTLLPGWWSGQYSYWNWQVKKFMIANGCRAASQYSPAGTHPYAANTYYNVNGLSLNLTVVC